MYNQYTKSEKIVSRILVLKLHIKQNVLGKKKDNSEKMIIYKTNCNTCDEKYYGQNQTAIQAHQRKYFTIY